MQRHAPSVSPKKKARHVITRQIFALPALQQFEPVLASSPRSYMVPTGSIPKLDKAVASSNNASNSSSRPGSSSSEPAMRAASPAVAAMAPSAPESPGTLAHHPPHPPPREREGSPRVLRPQPPLPLGISSRADVDIYRYSQGTTQRMAIRPIFEQRKEDEAQVARQILAQREDDDEDEEHGSGDGCEAVEEADCQSSAFASLQHFQQGGELQSHSEQPDRETGRRTVDEDEAVQEFTTIKFVSPRSAEGKRPRPASGRSGDEASRGAARHGSAMKDECVARETQDKKGTANDERRSCSEAGDVIDANALEGDKSESLCTTADAASARDCQLVRPLQPGRYHEPFRSVDNDKLHRQRDVRYAKRVSSVQPDESASSPPSVKEEQRVLYKALWKELRTFDGRDVMLTVLLSSEATAHITIAPTRNTTAIPTPDDRDECALPITEAHVAMSTQMRRDLRVLTPKWAEWVLSRVQVDTSGKFYLQLEGTGALDASRCFDEQLCVGSCNLHIEMHVLGECGDDEVSSILLENSSLAAVAFLSQACAEDGMISALRRLQQREAVQLHAKSYVTHQSMTSSGEGFRELIAAKVEAAKQAKLEEIAICSIIEDMLTDLITYESRVELYEAKYSGGYDDHYASKVQATFRMSTQRKDYTRKKHTRMRAARLLQALQRGIIARRRYCEMKIEREKYLFYGFRSSLHHASASMENPKQRAQDIAEETERRRQTFLMQVLDGYIAEHGIAAPHRVSAELVESLFNEYGVVVGCATTFGEVVASFLRAAPDGKVVRQPSKVDLGKSPRELPRLYSTGQVGAALLLGLRSQYDDTFGLSPSTRRLIVAGDSLTLGQPESSAVEEDEVPPRWLLKISTPFQRSNRNRLAALRLSRKTAGRKSAHLVARDFKMMLSSSESSLSKFESCRDFWDASIRMRRAEHRIYDVRNRDEVVQCVLDYLLSSVKDWGVDPEPLFAGLNLCVRHRQGKEIVALVEAKFNAFAEGVNKMHGKRNILSLREEIEQELEDFEKLLALRCLNVGQDHVVTVPPSEILHIVLKGKVDDEYIRHALPTVLPIASISDKYELARKMVLAYANASYGDALNAICWSCLDVSENVTVESAQLLDRITRIDEQLGGSEHELRGSAAGSPKTPQRGNRIAAKSAAAASSSVATRALYLLTGAQAVTFLQFVAKVAHFNKTIQHRTLALLQPDAERFELHRLASTVAGLDDYDVTARLFDARFAPETVYPCTQFWVQYEELFGLDQTEKARVGCPPGLARGCDDLEGSEGLQSATP